MERPLSPLTKSGRGRQMSDVTPKERAESIALWAAFSLSYLHTVQPGVSACCADAKLRDLLTFIVILYTCNNFFFVMTMTDPNQSVAIFLYIIW